MADDLARRIAELAERFERLERAVERLNRLAAISDDNEPALAEIVAAPAPAARAPSSVEAPPTAIESPLPARPNPRATAGKPGIDWEQLIGGRAIGWAAVAALLFATAFFVRYAFANGWIGPLGRVATGMLAGAALVVRGWHYHRRGWSAFSQMLTAGGLSLLYLATYGAYGFYHLVDGRVASLYLIAMITLAWLLSLRYDALAIALVALVGAMLTPLLMHTERDQYRQFFTYLLAVNAGTAALRARRAWPAIGLVAFLGSEGQYWLWSAVNYHPEKRAWALCFQGALAAIYLALDTLNARRRPDCLTREDPVRLALVAVIAFGAVYAALVDDYKPWMSCLAIAVALLFAAMTYALVDSRGRGAWIATTALALSAGFLALALPLHERGPWNAVGWAVEAGVLAWFGLRTRMPLLRAMAAPLALLAWIELLTDDRWPDIAWSLGTSDPAPRAYPAYCASGLAAMGSLLASIVASRKLLAGVGQIERVVFAVAFVASLAIGGQLVAGELFETFNQLPDARLAQMFVSGWWSVYAGGLLLLGFYGRSPLLRWTALAIFGLTTIKVFFVDMADLDELYRVGAFFMLAALLGLAAWVYQRYLPSGAKESIDATH